MATKDAPLTELDLKVQANAAKLDDRLRLIEKQDADALKRFPPAPKAKASK